jgi:ATP-dependent exoDNAse (exonuclease V) alpha subunit
MSEKILSPDQEKARRDIHAALKAKRPSVTLVGPAGSGKTFLMRTIAEDLISSGRGVVMVAPTGKAAVRLRTLTGFPAQTIHSALYRQVEEDEKGNPIFDAPGWPCDPGDVLIADESSMIGERLHADITKAMPPNAQVLYVGDAEQLAPVGDDVGPIFGRPDARLTEVHRQALESPIIRLATEIRERDPSDWDWRRWDGWCEDCTLVKRGSETRAAHWLADRRKAGIDATLLAATNKTRRELNNRVRRLLRRGEDPEAGDIMVILRNNYRFQVMNGETYPLQRWTKVPFGEWGDTAQIDIWGGKTAAWSRRGLLDCDGEEWTKFIRELRRRFRRGPADPADLWLYLAFGECLTVHKAQGSEYREVGLFSRSAQWLENKDPDGFKRLLYTAVTRAAERLTIFD